MQTLSGEQQEIWKTFSPGPVQVIRSEETQASVSILRLDLIRSWATGNKYYKLKYAIRYALAHHHKAIVSKGGMYSNHLYALADACSTFRLQLKSVIRSYEPDENNPTIRHLRECGSEIFYVRPELYRLFGAGEAERLYPGSLFIPEGGLSETGIRGAAEMALEMIPHHPSHVILAAGTLCTSCGIISALPADHKVIIVPAWKGCTDSYFYEILRKYSIRPACTWEIWPDYHFGGFGRFNQQLLDYMSSFVTSTGIPLDPVYTGKLMYAVEDKLKSGYFKNSDSILAIHSGKSD